MNRKYSLVVFVGALAVVLMLSAGGVIAQEQGPQSPQSAIGTTFTYQGQLKNASGPVTGSCDFQFSLWDSLANATGQIGTMQSKSSVPLSQGQFTVQLDFGVNVFSGEARWLQIEVSCPAGSGSYTTLAPRQPLTPAPYALYSTSTGALQGRSITTTAPAVGQVLKWNGGAWSPADDAIGSPGSGDISGVYAGKGLTGGGASGEVTLTVSYAGSGAAFTAAHSDHNHWGQTWNGTGTGLTLSGGAIGLSGNGSTSGVYGQSSTGTGVYGSAPLTGTMGVATNSSGAAYGVYGAANSANGAGVYGFNPTGAGVFGFSPSNIGVDGASNTLWGVYGWSSGNAGVFGSGASATSTGVYGTASTTGTVGIATAASGSTRGVYGAANSPNGTGVYGSGATYGVSGIGTGIYGIGVSGFGSDDYGTGVWGYSTGSYGTGVYGAGGRYGVQGFAGIINGYGIYGIAYNGANTNWAGVFDGNVSINGTLSKSGGSFKIDHPLDPANKYLQHSFVESPDMLNIYNGNITTDANGDATVVLPDYFEVLNRDFRYQLTVIGQFAQAIVQDEITGNRFTIKTDKPNVKVSWQVTGIRQDAWANANRIPVETDKPANERGTYLYPQGFGQSETKGLNYTPRPPLEGK